MDQKWIDAVRAIANREQRAKVVIDKLQELNPEFDGKYDNYWFHGLTATSRFADISPLAAIDDLQGASLRGPPQGSWLSDLSTHVADLSPLEGMPLIRLSCEHTRVTDFTPLKGLPLKTLTADIDPRRDGSILRAISTLETINGKPAAEFWKEVPTQP